MVYPFIKFRFRIIISNIPGFNSLTIEYELCDKKGSFFHKDSYVFRYIVLTPDMVEEVINTGQITLIYDNNTSKITVSHGLKELLS